MDKKESAKFIPNNKSCQASCDTSCDKDVSPIPHEDRDENTLWFLRFKELFSGICADRSLDEVSEMWNVVS